MTLFACSSYVESGAVFSFVSVRVVKSFRTSVGSSARFASWAVVGVCMIAQFCRMARWVSAVVHVIVVEETFLMVVVLSAIAKVSFKIDKVKVLNRNTRFEKYFIVEVYQFFLFLNFPTIFRNWFYF